MARTSLGLRLFAPVAASLAVVAFAGALWGESRIRAFHREEVERRLATASDLLVPFARGVLRGETPPAEVRDLHLGGPLRVTVIAADGVVLADNMASLPLENHGSRPEVQEAGRSGTGTSSRTSGSTGWPTLYFARRVDGPRGPLGFIRAAEPLDRAEEEVASVRRALLLGGLMGLLLVLGASGFLARRLALPLLEMERSAARLAAGEFGEPVTIEGPEEMERLAGSLNRMAGQFRARMEAERHARADLESILAGVVEGVAAVDGEERILFMNAAAARILGLPAHLPPGGNLWESLRFPEMEDVLRAALRGGGPGRRDAPSPAQDGRIVEITAGPLAGGAGAVAVLRDVTEVRRLERIRMDFVANVSHELRTPLSGVTGALETLEDGTLDAEERERFLGIARRNADRLQSLVADLLDLSAIESEGTALPVERIPLGRSLRAAVSSLEEMAGRAGVALTLEPAPEEVLVEGNARRLEQAFVNLVENALKYTPKGGRVAVRCLAAGGQVAVEVEDTGIGIPADALPRIFERFYRVDPSRSRQMGGTGLGLAIVKHVALAHRGRIEVRSTEGKGTTFRMVLPCLGGNPARS